VPFWQLDDWQQSWDASGKVKRQWRTAIWPTSELYTTLDESFDAWPDRVRKFYDVDGTGKLSPEAVPAYRAAPYPMAEEVARVWLAKRERIEHEEEFVLVKRTIVVRGVSK
jgi:hypothetical protein